MTGAELTLVRMVYVLVTMYVLAVFVSCALEIRWDAQRDSNAREHPNSIRSRTNAESVSEAV